MWPEFTFQMKASQNFVLSQTLFKVSWSLIHTSVLILVLSSIKESMAVVYIFDLVWPHRKNICGNWSDLECLVAKQLVDPSQPIWLDAYWSNNSYHRLNSAREHLPADKFSPLAKRFIEKK